MNLGDALERAFAAHRPSEPIADLSRWSLSERQALARLIASEPGGPTYASAMRRLQRYTTTAGQRRGRIRLPSGLGDRMALEPFRRRGANVTFDGRVFVPSGRNGDCRSRHVSVHIPPDRMAPVVDAWLAGARGRAARLFEAAFLEEYGLAAGNFGCPGDDPDLAVDNLEVSLA